MKINMKILNIALWIEIILAYILPFQVVDGTRHQVGFPIQFITVYNNELGVNAFMSMHVNPLGLVLNMAIIYFAILAFIKVYKKVKMDKLK